MTIIGRSAIKTSIKEPVPLCDGIRASRKRIAIFISLTGVTLYSGIEAWNKINKVIL